MSLIGRIVTKILNNDDPASRRDDRYSQPQSGNLIGRIVTKILGR
ncbi:TFIIS helical bundle-like domain containing protein [Methylobacterium oryzihabitans]|jgi:hypothetical protein|uniref:TFIIS helical bundle-like domain containing protein n=1 Tax=Methylobacterium oryzihabitans TaxID=2499852 RepID=A0A437PHL3_9HYPH|nr:TFIIS helical bundle-like domain containing protein [Methylobacterium oryzihabitans]RVU21707.1 TFIIS helical bundle-like domain containing protein [Methylobacterium oryzihabitans]